MTTPRLDPHGEREIPSVLSLVGTLLLLIVLVVATGVGLATMGTWLLRLVVGR